ncbi:MAG: adenylate kinase [Ruminococcaceae bacterium]|nr:adenylate kinase [Oscillospiraceae bacterium]
MQKIIVIGCPGSGKSYFSKELHKITSLPLFHLDMMFWNPDKTTVGKAVFLNRLCEVLQQPEWIIDGNYESSMEARLKACDTVFFLDYPLEVCLNGIRERKGKPRTDIPWVETETDEEFLEFIRNYNAENRPKVISRLEKCSDKEVYIFKSREESKGFLESLKCR